MPADLLFRRYMVMVSLPLIPGITPINPLDVLDIVLMHRKDGAFILDTWTM